MNRIDNAFKNKPIFMPYFPLGYPDLDTSIDVIEALAKNGADLIEVGLSFSDPLADGPVIQKATQVALEGGITVKKSLAAVAELRKRGVTIPLILMGYYNPMLAYGLEKFIKDSVSAGVDGFIVPDLPMEESDEFQSALPSRTGVPPLPAARTVSGATRNGRAVASSLAKHLVEAKGKAQVNGINRPSTSLRSAQDGGLPLIHMLAPTSSPDRMEKVARNAHGFIYLVSVTGVTGARASVADGLGDLIAQVRKHTAVPVCVGFGIGTPEQAREVGKLADGVIVGSACVKTIGSSKKPVQTAGEFAKSFSDALQQE